MLIVLGVLALKSSQQPFEMGFVFFLLILPARKLKLREGNLPNASIWTKI